MYKKFTEIFSPLLTIFCWVYHIKAKGLIRNAIIIFSDNIPTLKLASWPLHCDLFDGDLIAGPVSVYIQSKGILVNYTVKNVTLRFRHCSRTIRTRRGTPSQLTTSGKITNNRCRTCNHAHFTYVMPYFRAHFDMSKFLRTFIQPEHVTMDQALELVNEPRYNLHSLHTGIDYMHK